MELTSEQIRFVKGRVSKWIRFYHDLGRNPTDGDAWHSALLARLLSGKEPLDTPPPERFSYPDYALAEGEAVEVTDIRTDTYSPGQILQFRHKPMITWSSLTDTGLGDGLPRKVLWTVKDYLRLEYWSTKMGLVTASSRSTLQAKHNVFMVTHSWHPKGKDDSCRRSTNETLRGRRVAHVRRVKVISASPSTFRNRFRATHLRVHSASILEQSVIL